MGQCHRMLAPSPRTEAFWGHRAYWTPAQVWGGPTSQGGPVWPIKDKTRLCSKPAAKGEKPAGPGQEAKGLPQGPPDLEPVSLNSEWQLWEATPNRLFAS